MLQAYKYSILYFLLFALLLLLSSALLFDAKIGLSIESILRYYQGDEENFIVAKSFGGVLKIILPHIFAFGLFMMVVLHFVVFTKYKQQLHYLTLASFIVALLELFSPFFIINGFEIFAYVKLASFFIFEFLLLYILWLLQKSIFTH